MCTKCKYIQMVEADYDQKYVIIVPKKCPNPEKCSGTNLVSISDLDVENCTDYQEIKIQVRIILTWRKILRIRVCLQLLLALKLML